jgi:hypothetical protein
LVKRFFGKNELAAYIGSNAAEVNTILHAHNFHIQPQKGASDKHKFSIIAILNIRETWWQQGERVTMEHVTTHVYYPAISMKNDFKVYHTAIHPYPLVNLRTSASDTVWLTIAHHACGDFDLLDYIRQLRSSQKLLDYSYSQVIFPYIHYHQEIQLPWLTDLFLGNQCIHCALMQANFVLDENGACQKSSHATGFEPTCVHKTLFLDQPVFVWIEREGLYEPLFAGYMPEKYWKE